MNWRDRNNGSGCHAPFLPPVSYCERDVRAVHDGRDGRRRRGDRHASVARPSRLPVADAAPAPRHHRGAAGRPARRREHAVGLLSAPRLTAPRRRLARPGDGDPLTPTARRAAAVAAAVAPARCGGAATPPAPPPRPPRGGRPRAADTPPPRGAPLRARGPRRPAGRGGGGGAPPGLSPPGHGVGARAGRGTPPPVVSSGAYVRAARCRYPVRTREPTGLLELDLRAARPAPLTLGDLFAVWGQPLSETRLAGFRAPPGGPVAAYLDGRRWPGDPRAIPLRR